MLATHEQEPVILEGIPVYPPKAKKIGPRSATSTTIYGKSNSLRDRASHPPHSTTTKRRSRPTP
jgi:hypothetical protein